MRRRTLLRVLVDVVAERGLPNTSVGLVVSRAGVSSRTFYELFDGLEGCVVAVLEDALREVRTLTVTALDGTETWLEGLVVALGAVLSFFDAEPGLARVCLVESLRGSPALLQRRQLMIASFRTSVTERIEGAVSHPSPLAAEGALAAVMGVVYERLIERERRPLIELLGPVAATLLAPFADEAAVAREIARARELALAIAARDSGRHPRRHAWSTASASPPLPEILGNPRARRARECMRFLAEHPASSNGEVAAGIGVAQKSQISMLLSRLLEEGLASKSSDGAGKRNAWRLTPHGERTAQALAGQHD
ncbi:MAG TPA: TetR/AcrR family transcriptional regulator [Solirubrobacteraceae bacterium]|jgi:AcrR family transcriptional regulator